MGKPNNNKGKKKKKTCLRPAIDVQNDANKNTCAFCHQPKLEGNEVERAGNLYKLGNKYYHYFCVLFCQGMDTGSGKDEEGLNGFLIKDVIKGLKYSSERTCYYCERKGAGLHCNLKPTGSCNKKYHFTCASEQGKHTFIFSGMMDTFCPNHRPKQRCKVKVKDMTCLAGCQEKILENEEKIMISPCCGRKYHLSCIQGMASASGIHHFKCPACSVKEQFLQAAIDIGVYVPDQDAAWEKDSFYDFESQGRLYQRCDAKICQCPKGREHHFNGSKFEIVRCESCGCGGVHILCGNLLKQSPLYICEKHSNNERQMLDHNESVKRSSLWRGSEDENSDEDESLSNTDSYKPISKSTVIRKTPASGHSTSLLSSDEDDSDFVPDEETTETSDTDKNKVNVPEIASDEVPNNSSKEASIVPSNEVPNIPPSNLVDKGTILIEDDTSSSESEGDKLENPFEVQEELSRLFQQSKHSPIKTYQISSTNMTPFALKHPTTQKRVALQAACSFSPKLCQTKDNVTPNTNLASSDKHLQTISSSSDRDLVLPSTSQRLSTSNTTVNDLSNYPEIPNISHCKDLISNEQGFLPTIEMTFSMANIPGDFPNMNRNSKNPEIVTTKIVGFDSNDVIDLESDDDIVCIDDNLDSSIDYSPREDLLIEQNNRPHPSSIINTEENVVLLD